MNETLFNRYSAFFFAGAATFLALFTMEVNSIQIKSSRPIAFLETSNGTVRRLTQNDYIWDRIQKGSELGAFDTISTGEGAYARVYFNSGGVLDLEPGTMVVLKPALENIQLNFVTGSGVVRVSEETKTQIKVAHVSEHAQVKVQVVAKLPETAVMAPLKSEAMFLEIKEKDLRGKFSAFTGKGEILTSVDLPPTPIPVFPPNDSVIDLSEAKRTSLEWSVPAERKAPPGGYELVIQPVNSRAKPLVTKLSSRLFNVASLRGGKYSWFVRSLGPKGERSPASDLQWVEILTPAAISTPTVLPVKVK